MTTKAIKKGDSSFVMETQRPTGWGYTGTVTIDIFDTNGTQLVTGGAVTVYAGDTIDGAIEAGSFSGFITTGNALEAGQIVAIGSDSDGYQVLEVDGYTAATKTLSFTTGTQEVIADNANVYSLEMSYTVDASGWSDEIEQVAVHWKNDGDEIAHVELWRLLGIRSDVAGLENEFRLSFATLYGHVELGDFDHYEARARARLKSIFSAFGKDFDRIVDSESMKELMLLEIAIIIGLSTRVDTEEYERLLADKGRQLDLLKDKWNDTDEDGTEDDGETEVGAVAFHRGLY